MDLEPRTDLAGLRRLEEREEPVALDLRALALDDRRRQRRVGDDRPERAADALDDVAALAVVVLDDAPAALDRLLARGELLDDARGGVQLLEAEDGRDGLVELAVGEAEVRHPQLLFPAAGAVAVEDARRVELRPEPVLTRVRQVDEPEVEAVNRLGALLGQLGADRLGVLEPGIAWQAKQP